MPVIGYLHSGVPGPTAPLLAAFRQGLSETGYVEGQNLAIEYRWAEGHYDRLSALAVDLVGRKVDVIVAIGDDVSALAAKRATSTIPLVFIVGTDPFFNSRRTALVALASHHTVPAIYASREFAASGGLISYGANLPSAYRQAGSYAGKILKGAKPADLPVEQPTKFDLVINLKTAKQVGLTIPPNVLAHADKVIR